MATYCLRQLVLNTCKILHKLSSNPMSWGSSVKSFEYVEMTDFGHRIKPLASLLSQIKTNRFTY